MRWRVGSAAFALILGAAALEVAAAGDSLNASLERPPATGGDTTHHSLRVYADPETGELVSPDSVELPSAAGSGGAGRTQAPVVVPAPTEAGGVMVDLRGQFMHETRAHVADGNLSADCIPAKSPP